MTKPTHTDSLPPALQDSSPRQQEASEPFRMSLVERMSELSEEDWDSEGSYSLDSALRDSMDILREAVYRRGWEVNMQATVEEQQVAIAQLKEEIAALRSSPDRDALCVFCQSEGRKVLFAPCHHLCCCAACALQVSHCPVCSQPVEEREEVFLSM